MNFQNGACQHGWDIPVQNDLIMHTNVTMTATYIAKSFDKMISHNTIADSYTCMWAIFSYVNHACFGVLYES